MVFVVFRLNVCVPWGLGIGSVYCGFPGSRGSNHLHFLAIVFAQYSVPIRGAFFCQWILSSVCVFCLFCRRCAKTSHHLDYGPEVWSLRCRKMDDRPHRTKTYVSINGLHCKAQSSYLATLEISHLWCLLRIVEKKCRQVTNSMMIDPSRPCLSAEWP